MKEKELYILNLEYVRAEFVVTYCLCYFADFDFDKKDVTLVIEKPSYNKFKAFIDSLDERINLVIVDRKPKKLFNRAIYRKTLSEVKNAGKAIEYIRFLRAEKKIVKTAKADIKQLFEGKRFDKVVNVGNTSYYWVKLVEALKCKNKKYLELRSFIVNDPNTDYYIKNKFWIDRYDEVIFLSQTTQNRYNALAGESDLGKQSLLNIDLYNPKLDVKISDFEDKDGERVYCIEEIPNEAQDRINLRIVPYVEKNTGLLLLSNKDESLDGILSLLEQKAKDFEKIIIFDFFYTITQDDIKGFENVELSQSSIRLGSFLDNFVSIR